MHARVHLFSIYYLLSMNNFFNTFLQNVKKLQNYINNDILNNDHFNHIEIKVIIRHKNKNITLMLSGTISAIQYGSLINLILDDFITKSLKSLKLYNNDIHININRSKLNYTDIHTAIWDTDDKIPKFADLSADLETKERYDHPDVLNRKCHFIAKEIMNIIHSDEKKKIVIHTGAGISTSEGIPDYRSENGVWTCRDKGQVAPRGKMLELVEPTFTHQFISKLLNHGYIDHVISQNIDNLHIRSGIPINRISELHGNAFVEKCLECKTIYRRDWDVSTLKHFNEYENELNKLNENKNEDQDVDDHTTGRKCDKDECKGLLTDTYINFFEELEEDILKEATLKSKESDFALCLGTSCFVPPACHLPEMTKGKLCIVNLQLTGKDEMALRSGGILIHEKMDKVFMKLQNILFFHYNLFELFDNTCEYDYEHLDNILSRQLYLDKNSLIPTAIDILILNKINISMLKNFKNLFHWFENVSMNK